MESNRSVAIVGRPNVGKSRLFNRLVGKRLAIVHDQPGVTRDVMIEEVRDGGGYVLMDTGGIGMKETPMTSKEIQEATEDAVDFALDAAGVILFVVDAKDGLTPLDQEVALKLRKYGKPVILVVNKIDSKKAEVDEFHRFGFKDYIEVSAEHGDNIRELEGMIVRYMGEVGEEKEVERPNAGRLRICFAGRPNVGKSSLTNRVLKADRMIVSDVPGTTRDSVKCEMDYTATDGSLWKFEMVDTAGLRPKVKVDNSVEYFAGVRTGHSIEDADVVFLVLDAKDGITKHEKRISRQVLEEGKGLILIVNKWDEVVGEFEGEGEGVQGYESEEEFRKAYTKAIREQLYDMPDSPIIYTSAKTGYNIEEILRRAKGLYDRMGMKLATGRVNSVIGRLLDRQKPKMVGGKRFKIYYATQIGNFPYKFKVFCNSKDRLDDTYMRYLEGEFIKAFQLRGCPVKFEFVGKPKRVI